MYKVCKKCKKLYWRNVSKCLRCNKVGTLNLLIPKEFKVLASTTVNISSKEHQKVPYNVLALKDEYGNTSIKKTFKDYKTGSIIKYDHVITDEFMVCTKIRYIEEAALKRILSFIKNKFKKLFIDIDLSDCKAKETFEAGKMFSKESLNFLFEALKENKVDYSIVRNDYSDLVSIKYNLKTKKQKEKNSIKLKIISINNTPNIKQEANTIYLINCKYYVNKNHVYKANLLFLTNNINLLKDFFSSGKIDDKFFYGEEAEVIFEELKNYE